MLYFIAYGNETFEQAIVAYGGPEFGTTLEAATAEAKRELKSWATEYETATIYDERGNVKASLSRDSCRYGVD
jgi:hypothetical protein